MERTSAAPDRESAGRDQHRDADRGRGSTNSGRGPVDALHHVAGNQAVQSHASGNETEQRTDGELGEGRAGNGATGTAVQRSPASGGRGAQTDGTDAGPAGRQSAIASGETNRKTPRGSVREVSASTVAAKRQSSDVAVVDVRSPEAFREGHVPGATNVPLSAVDDRVDRYRGADEIVAYCQSGRRSRQATQVMRASLGAHTRVSDFAGGMRAWRYPTETGDAAGQSRTGHIGRSAAGNCSTCRRERDPTGTLVQRLHETGVVQASLTVSQPSDPAEREAERVADAVMQPAAPGAMDAESTTDAGRETCPQCGLGRSTDRDGDCLACQPGPALSIQSAGTTRRTTDSDVTDDVAARVRSVSSGGRSLPGSVQTFFESRFGRDFSDVRVHTGGSADRVARQLEARAFTVGTDVVFRSGAYRPFSSDGKRLLAHELTHVVQQGGDTEHVQRQDPLSSWPEWVNFEQQTTEGAADIKKPGDCSKRQHRWLQDNANKWCKRPFGKGVNLKPSCSKTDSCGALRAKAQAAYNCWHFRNKVNTTCFRGGDAKHRRKAAEALKRMATCLGIWHNKCKNRHRDPDSDWEWEDYLRPAAWAAGATAAAKATADAAVATWGVLGQVGSTVGSYATMPIIVLPGTRQALEQQRRGPRKFQ